MTSIFRPIEEYILQSKEERQRHLALNEGCILIGGGSKDYRALLAHFLLTTIPSGRKIHLCHACDVAGCSNPRHLYWGTAKENQIDADLVSYSKRPRTEKERQLLREVAPWNKGIKGLKRKPLTEEHRAKISRGVKAFQNEVKGLSS